MRTIALAVALCATAITPILATPAVAQQRSPFNVDTRVVRIERVCRLYVRHEIVEISYNADGFGFAYRRTGQPCDQVEQPATDSPPQPILLPSTDTVSRSDVGARACNPNTKTVWVVMADRTFAPAAYQRCTVSG